MKYILFIGYSEKCTFETYKIEEKENSQIHRWMRLLRYVVIMIKILDFFVIVLTSIHVVNRSDYNLPTVKPPVIIL